MEYGLSHGLFRNETIFLLLPMIELYTDCVGGITCGDKG
ncbi:hypothetical protein yinte0001_7340 [Yersinia intermedia ATCC 29909]|nr:hypothetical protein yinte0001_7340 [Yersinia intermedia ATCC 29909]